jgi:hypothetical protein
LGADGQPFEGAEVFVSRWESAQMDRSRSTYERLRQIYFKTEGITDKEGRVTMSQCFRAAINHVRIWADDYLAAGERYNIPGGEEVVMRCDPACVVRGNVQLVGDEEATESSVRLWAFVNDEWRGLGGGFVKDDGSYYVESVPIDVPVIMAGCIAEGFASQVQIVERPEAGREYRLDFSLEPGMGGKLVFRTDWGEAIAGAGLKFDYRAGVATPYFYRTSAEGVIELPAVLPKEEPLDLRFTLPSGIDVQLGDRFRGGSQEFIVPDLTRIVGVEAPDDLLQGATITEAYWIPSSSSLRGYASWRPSSGPSPLLTSGLGVMSIVLSDGRQVDMPTRIDSGPETVVAVEVEMSELNFSLPPDLPTHVELVSIHGSVVFAAENLAAEITIPCPVGGYSIYLANEQGTRTIPGIDVPSEGLDLGRLTGVDSGEVWGTVVDASGNPMPSVGVYLSDAESYQSSIQFTDARGGFRFTELSPGLRYIFVASERGYGTAGSNLVHEFFSPPGATVGPIELVLGSATRVTGTTDRTDIPLLQAFLAGSHGMSSGDVGADGSFSLPAASSSGWLGLSAASAGESWLVATRVPSGPGDYFLKMDGMKELAVEVVDETGAAWTGLTVRMELADRVMPYRTVLDQDGRLLLHTQAGLPLSLSIRRPDGSEKRVALDTAASSQRIVLEHDPARHAVTVLALDGSPVPGAIVTTDDLRQTFRLGATGSIEIPSGLMDDLWVAAPGYLIVPIPPTATKVRLPRAIADVAVHCPVAGAASLRWMTTEEYILDYVLSGSAAAPTDDVWKLVELPEGKVVFTVYDTTGAVIHTATRDVTMGSERLDL